MDTLDFEPIFHYPSSSSSPNICGKWAFKMNHYKKIYFSDLFEMDFCYSIFGPLPFRNERRVATLSLKVEKKLDIYLLFDVDINNQNSI